MAGGVITMLINFYPRPPRGGRPRFFGSGFYIYLISIHALREEGDFQKQGHRRMEHRISIHALREEGDGMCLR